MKPQTVHLGFEVGSGEAVEIPLAHLCVTGQTQLSGKTTTLEALVARSELKAVAFITKRGESAFTMPNAAVDVVTMPGGTHFLRPFFRHRADWQFVSDILGAILSEKLKFQRPWIMKVCRGAKNLADVQARVKKELGTARGLSESVYTELDAYFDLLIPEIERLPYTDKLELRDGLNVMDLSAYSTALQMLVISSVLDEVYKHHRGVITVIPEAWEFVPNNKNSPAKSAAITLARKGAALKNFNWYDSQDLASIDTEIRRSVSVWILGVQREQNEVKRMLSHIPNAPKPKVDDVMQLEKGQFFVCHGREVTKVYVQPAWMDRDDAHAIAIGANTISEVEQPQTRVTVSRVNSKTGERMPLTADPSKVGVEDSYFFIGGKPAAEPTRAYGQTPNGIQYFVDDGGKSVDQQEREQYESQLRALMFYLYTEKREGPKHDRAKELSFEEWRVWFNANVAKSDTKPAPEPLKVTVPNGYELPSFTSDVSAALLAYKPFTDAIAAMMPTNGTIKVEPREVVLREYQEAEVERILSGFTQATPWQKSVVRYLHAKGTNSNYTELVRAVKGKEPAQHSGDQNKRMKEELKSLVQVGVLRNDSAGRYFPELGKMVKDRLAQYNASDKDVEDVIGQVLLRVKL